MDELFRKLGDYEQAGAYREEQWTRLDALLRKKRRRRLLFWWLGALIPLVLIGGLWAVLSNGIPGKALEPRTNDREHEGLKNAPSAGTEEAVSKPEGENSPARGGSLHWMSAASIATVPNAVPPDVERSNVEDRVPPATGAGTADVMPTTIARESDTGRSQARAYALERMFMLHPELSWPGHTIGLRNTPPLETPSQSRLRWFAGVRSSALNSLAAGNGPNRSYAVGLVLRMDYKLSRKAGISFQPSLHSEFNQQLRYSFTSDREVFLRSSAKTTTVSTDEVHSLLGQVSAYYRLFNDHTVGAGVYFNYVCQTRSTIRTTGSGRFSEFHERTPNAWGYHGLLNPYDHGLYLRYSFGFHPLWELGVEGFVGWSDRLRKDYFPERATLRRREVSMTIIRHIR